MTLSSFAKFIERAKAPPLCQISPSDLPSLVMLSLHAIHSPIIKPLSQISLQHLQPYDLALGLRRDGAICVLILLRPDTARTSPILDRIQQDSQARGGQEEQSRSRQAADETHASGREDRRCCTVELISTREAASRQMSPSSWAMSWDDIANRVQCPADTRKAATIPIRCVPP